MRGKTVALVIAVAVCGLGQVSCFAQAVGENPGVATVAVPLQPEVSADAPEFTSLTPVEEALPDLPLMTEPVALDLTRDTCQDSRSFAGCCDAFGCKPTGYKFTWAPDKWAKVGAGIRTSFNTQSSSQVAGGGTYFTIDNARLLTSGQITKILGFELNSDIGIAQGATPATLALPTSYNLLDAIAKIEASDYFNVWMGQFLPPSDRSNIDGPFFINGWDFPFVSNYPAIFQGRQLGAAYWGQLAGGQLKWSVGAFNGTGGILSAPYMSPPDNPPSLAGNIQFDARVTLNLLDPEPGYYHQSSYYGEKDILAIGFAIQTQNNAVGTAANPANFVGMNFDGLFEKKLSDGGVVTLEGAVYHYSNQDLVTSSRQGSSGFVYAGYLFPYTCPLGKLSGRFRPYTRYQQYNHDFRGPSLGLYSHGVDVGTEYVMQGPNARLTAVWSNRDVIGGPTVQIVRLAAQFIF